MSSRSETGNIGNGGISIVPHSILSGCLVAQPLNKKTKKKAVMSFILYNSKVKGKKKPDVKVFVKNGERTLIKIYFQGSVIESMGINKDSFFSFKVDNLDESLWILKREDSKNKDTYKVILHSKTNASLSITSTKIKLKDKISHSVNYDILNNKNLIIKYT